MQLHDGRILISASDLMAFLECEHVTGLDFLALGPQGESMVRTQADESAELVARKGIEHEQAYVARLRTSGLQVIDLSASGRSLAQKAHDTLGAMRAGADVIYQATLHHEELVGHPDFLLKVVGRPSIFGDWSYEVADTKLARTPKAKFMVQLAFYSHLVERAQGSEPQRMHVVLGDQSQRAFACRDFLHYFRALLARYRARLAQFQSGQADATYPLPCARCDLCHWRERCETQREADDHLSLVADIRRVQWQRLQQAGVLTVAQLAMLPPEAQVARMHADTLAKLVSQASLQVHQRTTGERVHLLLPVEAGTHRGFLRLPEPDAGDMYFDMEGDPLEEGGLEYLFGVGYYEGEQWHFRGFWAHDRQAERQAFEQFMDFVVQRRARHPRAHIYHYASYEETALKRLASVHGTRESAVDDLLRAQALVDLYKVVRESIRISEPSYSIKFVEHFYRPARSADVQNAGASIVWYERWRQTQDQQLLDAIETYNRDDVESTQQLHAWLLGLRPQGLPWRALPAPPRAGDEAEPAAPTRVQQQEQRLSQWRERLVDGLPVDRKDWTAQHELSELVWQLLDFHRRADKPGWWALFARMDQSEDELLEDAECLAGLQLDPDHPPRPDKRSTLYTYVVPPQETKLATGDACTRCDTGEGVGTLEYDQTAQRVRLKIGPKKAPLPPRLAIGPSGPIDAKAQVEALYRFAQDFATGANRYVALNQLLRRELPRLAGWAPQHPIIPAGIDLLEASIRAVLAMDRTYLYVQGPPGAGKTYTGARMILALLRAGQRVGIMSNSHKAIHNLLAGVLEAATEAGVAVHAVKKASSGKPDTEFDGDARVDNIYSNGEVFASGARLVAGTSWLFADADADQTLDALFVDEAGQVALANLVAAGTCARNLVLLGDQMQLSQPVQGVHPGRSGDSALDYLLDGAPTIAPERGIFLATTWRMHPRVCDFVSEAVYEGRLLPQPSNVQRELVLADGAHPLLQPAGLVHAPVEHEGCSQACPNEADLIAAVYASALGQQYTDRQGNLRRLSHDNVLVMAPYNVQVNLLKRTLPPQARVGTVDKFQGQEAELVLVSMTTSSEQDLPRNIDFLYSKNRLNVAISRAKCLAIVVANPKLTAIACTTPEQMALVNLLCWLTQAGRFQG